MKRFLGFLLLLFLGQVAWTLPLPDNMYFRAMHDEMQRTLQQLRLKDHPNPYYVAYWIYHYRRLVVEADLGTLAPALYDPNDDGAIVVEAFVSVGSDKQDGLGFIAEEADPWTSGKIIPFQRAVVPGYEGLRQALWKQTDKAYVEAVDLYKKKQAYKKKKNIHDTLPDVVAAPAAQYAEPIVPFEFPDIDRLKQDVERISALGKTRPFLEKFQVSANLTQQNNYFLNSRGAFLQQVQYWRVLDIEASYRQADGKKANVSTRLFLTDSSAEQLAKAYQAAEQFLARIDQAYTAQNGQAYIGPVLLKPRAAGAFVQQAVLRDLQHSKPFLLAYAQDDINAGKLHKKRSLRVSTDLLTIYDRPLQRTFEGVPLAFTPVDAEGVAAQNLTLIENGYVKEVPLTQRPLGKNHRSNGHANLPNLFGPVEELTNVFVEPTLSLTDEQMEEKLRQRCRELGLEYGYILYDADPSGDLGIERIYTQDGRKEGVLNLKWDGNFFTQRDLRSVRAVGGKMELVENTGANTLVAPSILLEEVELVPQEHQSHRKPFLPRPK